jgi:alkyldihydroxyacetonephosphate synthase
VSIVERLRTELGSEKVVTDTAVTGTRRHDYWMLSQLDDAQGRGAPNPACVVRAATRGDVVRVVNACRESLTPLVPFGLGSGVCGAIVAAPDAVVLDLGGMNRVVSIDGSNLLATFEAGVRGSDAEDALAKEGLTLGHYPQSIGVSSVGGWVATRASGQFSTAYGNVEDVLFSLEAVLPNGEVVDTRKTPRASSGPDLRHVFLGSEGTLGVVTGVTFSVRRTPEKRVLGAYHVDSMRSGFELQREIVQSGLLPAVLRQYDEKEATRNFAAYARGSDALLLVVHEGLAVKADAEAGATRAIAARLGAREANPEATERWLADRNHVPSFRSFIENGIVVDTIEIASTWDKIGAIYTRAIEALGGAAGILSASAHSSHVYRSGVNLYFTFAAKPEDASNLRPTYLDCWKRVMTAVIEGGGGIAHHHGIGRVRRAFLQDELGPGGVALLRALKTALDPVGFMNPGALIPD